MSLSTLFAFSKVLSNNDIEVGVHIADVTHFLPQNSALDKEAAVRGTTFYLVDRRFDMLPSLLSSDLCSLHDHVDRLAVSVIWTFSSDFQRVKSTWYGRTIIHNAQAMTYDQAHNILHNLEPDDPNTAPPPPLTAGGPVNRKLVSSLKKDLTFLTQLARKRREDREKIGGAVDLSSGDRGSELKFTLDCNGNPIKVIPKKEKEIHHTIAELMIMANEFVAESIHHRFPQSSLLRIHRSVGAENFEELKNLLNASGINFNGSSNRELALTLKKAQTHSTISTNSLFQSLATRAMSEAQYICSGSQNEAEKDLAHYGLGISIYTHFTSPIRRYADVAVHRLLLTPKSSKEPRREFSRPTLVVPYLVPESSAISILAGDGLKSKIPTDLDDLEGDELLDALIGDISDNIEKNDHDASNSLKQNPTEIVPFGESTPFQTKELINICERLNLQNRIAKLASMQCQRLFLSLFFKSNIEITQGIVIGLRQNGVIVYVPKYDMKGPVFLSDREGNVQVDPRMFGLATDSGLPPSSGFASLEACRMFPEGQCLLQDGSSNAEREKILHIEIPASKKKISFKVLDAITVQMSCDLSKSTARIPPPRLHLISASGENRKEDKVRLMNKVELSPQDSKEMIECSSSPLTHNSIFQVVSSIGIYPGLPSSQLRFVKDVKKESDKGNRKQRIKGRLNFGGFRKYDDVPQASSSALSGLNLEDQAKMGNYDAARRLERDVTARIQRKMAEKRNTKISKGRKR